MNILQKFTKKDLKLNKKRTIGTLVGIILATALITAVGGMAVTLQNSLFESEKEATGYYHIRLSNVSDEEVEKIKLNKDYNHYEIMDNLGTSPQGDEEYSFYTSLYSMNKEGFEYLKKHVTEGTFPKNENEIIIDDYYAIRYGYKVGDEINLEVGNINFETNELTDAKEYNFKISGIMINNGPESTMITTNINSNDNELYLTLKNPKNCKKDFEELLGVNPYKDGQTKEAKYDYKVNAGLLKWEVGAFGDSTTKLLYGMIGVVVIVILVTSVFSIRNSFAISTTEKLKTYGMLSSVGATKKQIRKMVLYEGRRLGLVGISIGCVFGSAVVYVLTQTINLLFKNISLLDGEVPFVYKFSIIPIILAIVVGTIMIFLSTITCAIKASKVSPIQNLRNADNLSSKKIKLKTPKYIKELFNIGGVLSYKNLKRSKRKYRVTIISLTVSIFVFISVSTFLEYGFRIVKEEYKDISFNMMVMPKRDDESKIIGDFDVNKITNLGESYINYMPEDTKSIGYVLKDTSKIKLDKLKMPICVEYKDDETYECSKQAEGTYLDTYILDNNTFKKYANEIGANYNDIKDKAIIINTMPVKEGKVKVYKELTNYKINDEIEFESINPGYPAQKYKVGALTDKMSFGLEFGQMSDASLILVLNKDYVTEKTQISKIFLNVKDADKAAQELEKMDNIYFENIADEVKILNTIILMFSIFIYGFITVITLIGITSVFNTITSNIELRQKDFATLKSIGMTKKEFNRMITLESLFYSAKSLFIGLILGLSGSYMIYKLVSRKIDYGYILPTKSIIISILFITVVVFMIMKYSISKVNKQNIIETIRKDNI